MAYSHSNGKRLVVDPALFPALCTCGREHPRVNVLQYTGTDAYEALAQDAAQTLGRDSLLLLDDGNTHEAAGARIGSLLTERRVEHEVLTLARGIHATEALADEVRAAAQKHGLIVAVGAGTVNDLGKYAGAKLSLPYWSAPTAPSMNGFTSSIAAISVAGVKRTLPAPPPQNIYADPEVIRRAPARLIQAGYCDIMAKSVSDVDWQLDSLLFGGTYCALSTGIVARTEAGYADKPSDLRRGDAETVMGLFHGLLASGLAMSLAGSSAPASGGEHLISHFLDMREPFTGREPELHGLQVALGILISAACYTRLAVLKPERLGADPRPIYEAAARDTAPLWGDIAPEVLERFDLKREQLMSMPQRLQTNWPRVRDLCRRVRPAGHYLELFQQTGLEMSLESLRVPRDEFMRAALLARTIRERITVLDLAAQGSVLEEAAEEVAGML